LHKKCYSFTYLPDNTLLRRLIGHGVAINSLLLREKASHHFDLYCINKSIWQTSN
jgi:hypothetical protein